MNDLERAKRLAADAVGEASKLVDRAAQKTAAAAGRGPGRPRRRQRRGRRARRPSVDDFVALHRLAARLADEATVAAQVNAVLGGLKAAIGRARRRPDRSCRRSPATRSPRSPSVLQQVLDAADLIEDIHRFVNGFDPSSVEARFRFEWRPELAPWFFPGIDRRAHARPEARQPRARRRRPGQRQGRHGRARCSRRSATSPSTCCPARRLVRITFDHLSFKAGTSGKAEVDVVIGEIEFVGYLVLRRGRSRT